MITLEQAQKIAKPFVSKSATRPILTAALVKNGLLTATDSHRLIRIKTNSPEEALVHYSDYTQGYDSTSYPQTDRLMPDLSYAKQTFKINVAEWLKIHKEALPTAKQKDYVITLKNDRFSIDSYDTKDFEHRLTDSTGIEKVTYNCKYMIEALQAAKKLKLKELTFHFITSMRPFVLTGENVEILILPVRVY